MAAAPPLTVSDLRVRVRERADAVNNENWSDDEILRNINTGWSSLHDQLVALYEDWVLTSSNVVLVANEDTYSLDDFDPPVYKTKGVDMLLNGRYIPMDTFEWAERGIYPPGPNSFSGTTLRVWYIPKCLPLSDANPQPDGTIASLPTYVQDNWAEIVVLEAALLCAAKEEGMAGNIPILSGLLDKRVGQLIAAAPNRDAQSAPRGVQRAAVARGYDAFGPIPRLRLTGRAPTLRYSFRGMDLKVLGGVWP